MTTSGGFWVAIGDRVRHIVDIICFRVTDID